MEIINEFARCKVCNGEIDNVNSTFDLVKCQECKFIFSKKKFSTEDFILTYDRLYNAKENLIYKKHSIEEYHQLQKGIIRIGYNRKRIIKSIITKHTQNVLEVGSGIGLIGMYLKRFNNLSYYGLELDEKTHQRALSLGVNSVNGDFSKMETFNEKFDVIMMWEVLEHLQDLQLFFQLAKERLNTKGVFVFSVPNFAKIDNYRNAKDKIYQSGPPVHLNFFTKESLKEVLNWYGFDYVMIKEKKFPYFNFKSLNFYKMFFNSLIGKYNGPTLYVTAKLNK
ncbi:bifunctional 2-polyprenyl-6-hydroxyphenol methylase/3-demethylubiquinol 3-O-methyltransferase UbiG [Flavobacterium sp. LM4]|uniref:class I SAM-dependent methyltransferase n=1 Tax=Flavobacterium sp. LM4 TaxID=1938609 RepID=UPI000992ED57|nr:class I SAM-dependent methyltransferase [Flavobacterium sp. LM4]OOV18397.1 hypothetical protein BXU10_01380 [Flavobacterium sp. LM4]